MAEWSGIVRATGAGETDGLDVEIVLAGGAGG